MFVLISFEMKYISQIGIFSSETDKSGIRGILMSLFPGVVKVKG